MSYKTTPARKTLSLVKVKYSPAKKTDHKSNNVFVKEYRFGLLTLELKKAVDPNEDAFIKDFVDLLDGDKEQKISNDLNIIKVVYARKDAKASIAKLQSSGYKSRVILGVAPMEHENDAEFRQKWANKIIEYLNKNVTWRYSNVFKFKGDLTKMFNGKVAHCLDDVLLDEDIGGFVGRYLYDSYDLIKDNKDVIEDIFSNPENAEVNDTILLANWSNWGDEED